MSMTTPNPQSNNVQTANQIVQQMGTALRRSPATVGAVINSGDSSAAIPAAAAVTFGGAANSVDQHQVNYNSHSLFQSVLTNAQDIAGKVVRGITNLPVVGKDISTALQWANKPLQEIQKDYKFVNAVYADHGVGAGLLATLGVLGGGAVGAVFSGGVGFAAGADAALMAERNIFGRLVPQYHDALMKSEDPNYNVSLGRELAQGLSNIPGFGSLKDTQHGIGQFVSGATDAAADLTFDPLIVGGKFSGAIKKGTVGSRDKAVVEYAKDADGKFLFNIDADGRQHAIQVATQPAAQSASGIIGWLQSKSGVAFKSGDVTAAYENGKISSTLGRVLNPLPSTDNITAALDHIGTLDNPAAIAQQYPDLARQITPYVLKQLSIAKDGAEAAKVLDKSIYSAEIADNAVTASIQTLTMPTRTLGRALVARATENIRQRAGETTANEERNLLLPKKAAIMVPLVDKSGAARLDAKGNPMMRIAHNFDGSNRTQILQGGLLTGNIANALAGKIRTFTGYRALSVNARNIEQSARQIDLSSPTAGTALYNMAMYAMPHSVAMEKAAQIVLERDLGKQATQYGELVKEIIKTAGVRNDSNLLDHIMSEAQRTSMNGSPALKHYATLNGQDIGTIRMRPSEPLPGEEPKPPTSQNVAAWTHQFGSHGIIDFKVLRKEVRNANVYNRIYNSADDFFTFYTERIFAPLTLFTSGFGVRVASSEALHQVMRNGLGSYLSQMIAGNALKSKSAAEIAAIANKADKVALASTKEDLDHAMTDKLIKSNEVTKMLAEKEALWKSIGMPHPFGYVSRKMAPYFAKDKMRTLALFQDTHGGMIIPGQSASGHLATYRNAADEEIDQGLQNIGHGKQPGERIFDLFPGTDPAAKKYWALNLSKVRHEQAARDIANDWFRLKWEEPNWSTYTNDEKWQKIAELHVSRIKDPTKYVEERVNSVGLRNGDPNDFGNYQVSALRGMVQGNDTFIHENLLQNVINRKPTMEKDLKDIPINSMPTKILGQVNRPTMSNPLERVMETGYRTFVNPIVDYISRQPIFGHYLHENFRAMQPMIDAGLVNERQAISIAAHKASGQMLPLIHNPAMRSQFAMIHRNLLPFYFAQEQAMKRVGRLISTNPQAFREFQMIEQGMNNPGFVHTDANGTKYIVYPLLGEFGNWAARGLNSLGMTQFTGIPTSVTGSTASLLSVLPEMKMPGVGPFANMALTEAAKIFPFLDKATNVATGGYPSKSWLSTVMPNSAVRDIFMGLTMDQRETVVHNSFLSAVAAAAAHGDIPDGANGTTSFAQMSPADQQAIMDKIENNAKTNLFIKGILAFFLPLSPSVSNDYYTKDMQTLRSEFINMTLPVAQGGLGLDLKTATAKFTNEHGNGAISYTVSHTASGTGGAYLPLASSTTDWLSANKDIMSKYGNGAAYLVPQVKGTPDALSIEQKLLTMHLRSQVTPKDFLDSIFVAKGWQELQSSLNSYEAAIKQSRGEGNRIATSRITNAWNATTLEYGKQNPIWYANYKDTTKNTNADKALSDLQALNKAGKLGTSGQSTGIADLLSSYETYHAILQQNQSMNGAKRTPFYSQIQNQWYDYLAQRSLTNPELANVISGVFKRVV